MSGMIEDASSPSLIDSALVIPDETASITMNLVSVRPMRTCWTRLTLLNARLRRDGVANPRSHGVRDRFLYSEDAVAGVSGVRRRIETMASYSLDQMTTAMPLPDTSGEGEQAAN